MLVLLSPAKTMNFERPVRDALSNPAFENEAKKLASVLKSKSQADLQDLMDISENLAELNYERYRDMKFDPQPDSARAALDVFEGDVYKGIDSQSMEEAHWQYAQQHIRILSGLYGYLRPLDRIQPYRLEMGTKLPIDKNAKNLYEFWQPKLGSSIEKDLENQDHPIIVNLASNEYFKAMPLKDLSARVLEIKFKEWRDGKLKFISFYAKKARGLMARYMMDHGVSKPEELQGFDYEGYQFESEMSSDWEWVFTRES